jgi:hypothetical protein
LFCFTEKLILDFYFSEQDVFMSVVLSIGIEF